MNRLTRFCLMTFTWLALSLAAHAARAQVNYPEVVQALHTELDKTLTLYQTGDVTAAKSAVQMAYFDHFEAIEGAVRINFSQQYSYQLEQSFGVIRQMIAKGESEQAVAAKILTLKTELAALPDALNQGYRLDSEMSTLNSDAVALNWQEAFDAIENHLADALAAYRAQEVEQAVQAVQKAQFEGYKNSGLETAIRMQQSAPAAKAIDQGMHQIIFSLHDGVPLQSLAYEVTLVLDQISEQLVGLPAPTPVASEATTAPANSEALAFAQVQQQLLQAVRAAFATYRQGDVEAAVTQVQDSYFDLFEATGLERQVGALDVQQKTQIEGYFTKIVSLMLAQSAPRAVEAQIQLLEQDLAQAITALSQGSGDFWMLFLASLMILLREGLEALLIVGAITAFLIKSKQQQHLAVVRHAVFWALAASAATAFLFHWVFQNSGMQRELLEGMTMLLAAVLMFSMSYWVLAKVEAERWKKYIQTSLSSSLSKGSLFGFWMTCFLAVYREGAETILFYGALMNDTQPQTLWAVGLGVLVASLGLAVVYGLMRFSMVRIPLRTFFMVTGSFIYCMAFVFAGKGMLELMEAKVFEPTLLGMIPEVSLLGIYPYLETLAPQLVLFIAALVAVRSVYTPNKPVAAHA
jgi:high-affinity iron transporter